MKTTLIGIAATASLSLFGCLRMPTARIQAPEISRRSNFLRIATSTSGTMRASWEPGL